MTPWKSDHHAHDRPLSGCSNQEAVCQVYDGLPWVFTQSRLQLVNVYNPNQYRITPTKTAIGIRTQNPIIANRTCTFIDSSSHGSAHDDPCIHPELRRGRTTDHVARSHDLRHHSDHDVHDWSHVRHLLIHQNNTATGIITIRRSRANEPSQLRNCNVSVIVASGGSICSRANQYRVPPKEQCKSGARPCQLVHWSAPCTPGQLAASGQVRRQNNGLRRPAYNHASRNTGSPVHGLFRRTEFSHSFECSIDVTCGAAGQDIRRCAQGSATTRPTHDVNIRGIA